MADIIATGCGANFTVPNGFSLSVTAFEQFLASNSKIVAAIDTLGSQCANPVVEVAKLEQQCERIEKMITESTMNKKIVNEIQEHLSKAFGSDFENVLLAVRSSAVGEDSADASGAGQMSTFLGVKGFDDVIDKIKQCWVSHFSFRAVQYRRQLCANMDNKMSVVVQELVKAQVAGVLFTRHPDNGSINHAIINASYGLGESVVSGEVLPDSISVYDDGKEKVRIVYDFIGEKATAYRVDDEQGLIEETKRVNSPQCCMSDREIETLYKIGKDIEEIFGSPRDVEFAITDGKFYILQARPITTMDNEEDWELLQEFDTPLASNQEWITTANVQ